MPDFSLPQQPPRLASVGVNIERSSDHTLALAMRNHDSAALQELYDRYGAAAYALALRMIGDPQRAEACVQTVFLQFWRQPPPNDPDYSIADLLLGAVHQHAASVDAPRERQRFPTLVSPLTLAAGAAVARPTGRASALLQLAHKQAAARNALASLPLMERIVLELAYFDGLTQVSIAAALGQTPATVQTLLRTGMTHLGPAFAMPAVAAAEPAFLDQAVTPLLALQHPLSERDQQPRDQLAAALVALGASQARAADLRFRAAAVRQIADRTQRRAAETLQRADLALRQLQVLRELYTYLGTQLDQEAQPGEQPFAYTEAYFSERRQDIDVSQVMAVLTLLNAHSDREAYERLPALLS